MQQTRVFGLAMMVFVFTAATVFAQSPNATPSRNTGSRGGGIVARLKSELNLSDNQVRRLVPILQAWRKQTRQHRQQAMERFKAVLTPQQLQTMQQLRQQRQQGGAAQRPMQALKLTPEQKDQLVALRQQSRTQAKTDRAALFGQTSTVLNAQQETRFEQMFARQAGRSRQSRQQRQPGGHRPQGGQSPSPSAPVDDNLR